METHDKYKIGVKNPTNMNKNKNLTQGIVVILSFVTSIVLGHLFFYLLYYVHEGGHVVFALFLNYKNNQSIINYNFSQWSEGVIPTIIPTIFKIPIPTQTHTGGIQYNIIAFGGIFLSIVFTLLISLVIWYKSNQKGRSWIFLLPILVIIQQIIMNAICGTDNLTRSYSSLCLTPEISDSLQIVTPWLIGVAFWPFIFILFKRHLSLTQ